MSRIFLLAALTLVLAGSACKSKRVVTTTDEDLREMDGQTLLATLAQHQVQADWLQGKCRVSFDDGRMSVSASSTIKMKRDSLIWMNVKKLGFEIARAMITKDSMYLLDRINNEYAVEPISYIEERFRLPANLSMLQQILLGNPVYLTTSNLKSDLDEDDGTYRLSAQEGDKRNDFWFSMPAFQFDEMKVEESEARRSLRIQLQDYQDAGANRDFSYLRLIEVDSRETGRASIELEFNQVEINEPLEFNFSVPSRYRRTGK